MRFLNWEGTAYELLCLARRQKVPEDRQDYVVRAVMRTLARDPACWDQDVGQDAMLLPWFNKNVIKDAEKHDLAALTLPRERGMQAAQDMLHIMDWARDLPDNLLNKLDGHPTLAALHQMSRSWYKAEEKKALLPLMKAGAKYVCPGKDAEHSWYHLLTKQAFANEGKAMGHCVGSYWDKDTAIFSLRDKDGWPHLTVEVRKNKVNQSQGRSKNESYDHHIETLVSHKGLEKYAQETYEYREHRRVGAGYQRFYVGACRLKKRRRAGPNNVTTPTPVNDRFALYVRGVTNKEGVVVDPENAECEGSLFSLAPICGEDHAHLLPKSINTKRVQLGGPLTQACLNRVVDRKKGVFLAIRNVDGVKLPKLNYKAVVIAHSKNVVLPRGFSAPLFLVNATLKGKHPPVDISRQRIDIWVSQVFSHYVLIANALTQAANEFDCWYPEQAWNSEPAYSGLEYYEELPAVAPPDPQMPDNNTWARERLQCISELAVPSTALTRYKKKSQRA